MDSGHMLKNLCSDSLKKQGETEMVTEGKFEWFLGMWYTYNHSIDSVEADQ